MHRFVALAASAAAAALILSGCAVASTNQDDTTSDPNRTGMPNVVTGSTIVASLIWDIAGEHVNVSSLVPNAVDAHTYQPLPSEIALLENADMIVLADSDLNWTVTSLASEKKQENTPLVLLNEATVSEKDYAYWDSFNMVGKNPHTWTNARFVWYWVGELEKQLLTLITDEEARIDISANSAQLKTEINKVHEEILFSIQETPTTTRKMVVYHDAWVYFGREYGVDVVGSLQAIDYSEPSPAQLAKIIEEIKLNNVRSFFGSEVFPSDVLERISEETGAIYISDLSDDALPGEVGSEKYLYVKLMRNNLSLILQGLT